MLEFKEVKSIPKSRKVGQTQSIYAEDLIRLSKMKPGTKIQIVIPKDKRAHSLRSALDSAVKAEKLPNIRLNVRGKELFATVTH